jgi:flagellar biosynthesis/type III secretory pathway protein FliH
MIHLSMSYYPAYQPNQIEYIVQESDYTTGFEEGYSEGRKAGYLKGKERGYEEGYAEGIHRGIIFGMISMVMGFTLIGVSRATSRVE